MLLPSTEINNCYILQFLITSDKFTDQWLASAIYSPNKFLLRFLKDEEAVLKVLPEFRTEAHKYYGLKSEFLEELVEIEIHNDTLFISSEYHGELAAQKWFENKNSLSREGIYSVIYKLASAMDILHDHGIVYGCLNPECNQVIPLGMNLGHFVLRIPSYSVFHQYETKLENRDSVFLAPEQNEGQRLAPPRDIFSLGMVFAWFLMGNDEFHKTTQEYPGDRGGFVVHILEKLVNINIPEAVLGVIKKSLEEEPFNRYQNMKDFQKGLLESSQGNLRDEKTLKLNPEHFIKPEIAMVTVVGNKNLPVAVPRPEITNYFDELSKNFLSQGGQDSKATVSFVPHPVRTSPSISVPEDYEFEELEELEELGEEPGKIINPENNPTWKYNRFTVEDVIKTLRQSVERAFHSQGTLHFIGEPETHESMEKMEALYREFREKTVFIDLGSFERFVNASVGDFLGALRQGLAQVFAQESLRGRSKLADYLVEVGAESLFGAAPLGNLLFQKDYPTREVTSSDYLKIIQGLSGFGTRKKPLVLIVRGGECLQEELSELFTLFVESIKDKPLCIIIIRKYLPEFMNQLGVYTEV